MDGSCGVGLVVSPDEMDDLRVADWSGLTRRLESSVTGRVELPFAEIERLIGGRLPPSSQYAAFWSNSSSYAKAWKTAGYESTQRGVPGRVKHLRIAARLVFLVSLDRGSGSALRAECSPRRFPRTNRIRRR